MTGQPISLVLDDTAPSIPRAPRTDGGLPTHDVQFYENEHFLAAAVADFLAAGISVGQPLIVIATQEHREEFLRRLKAKGLDVEYASRNGFLTMLDAREMLAHFMERDVPDADRFRSTVGSVINKSLGLSSHRCVRAYGEMVDLLWKDGNTEGAIRLEELWNDLATTHSFSLLCAYAMGNFYKEAHTVDFRRICHTHARVIPAESYKEADEGTRFLEITLLQQRAQALESEIAHRKALEERLRQALADRAALLEREQAARADAEAANRAKSDFLAVMSHELRTPLNAIGGHVQLVEMGVYGEINEAQREALVRVSRSQRHLLSLITDVLNLARIETGHVEYKILDIPVAPLIADVISLVEPLLMANHLQYSTMASPSATTGGPLIIRADRERVHQILLNLLTNAIKFTAPQGRINIEAEGSADSSNTVCIRVSDTGIGIPSEKLQSIFEPFVQLRTDAGGREGLGLGLAISRDLARGMGGDLSATSTFGRGTAFTLRLPRA